MSAAFIACIKVMYILYSLETPQKRPHVDMMSEALLVDMTQDDGQLVKSFVSKHNG